VSDVGFEPTSANTRALEAPPLDQALVTRHIGGYNSYNHSSVISFLYIYT